MPAKYRGFADLVLQRANDIRVEEFNRLVEALGMHVAAAVGRALGG